MGKENFNREKFEGDNKKYRRSIFVSKNVSKNDIITKDNVAIVRPSRGVDKFLKKIIGKKFKKNIKKGFP